MRTYRKIWIEHHGEIPKDDQGRSYEIHHTDGDRENNDIDNLICITIQEHYDIHYKQGDFGACVMIAKRMSLPPEHLSNLQKGVKRPGVGGRKKGGIPWNKGLKGLKFNWTEQGLKNKALCGKKSAKIKDDQVQNILQKFKENISIEDKRIGKVQQNGKLFTYKRAFCEYISKEYGVTTQAIERIIKIHVQEKQ